MRKLIPVVDLFSGPGGLAEGFAAPTFLRKFRPEPPDEYYEYLNGSMSKENRTRPRSIRRIGGKRATKPLCVERGTDAGKWAGDALGLGDKLSAGDGVMENTLLGESCRVRVPAAKAHWMLVCFGGGGLNCGFRFHFLST